MQEMPKAVSWFDTRKNRNGAITLVTSVIWQASVGHAIENYPIWEYGGNHRIDAVFFIGRIYAHDRVLLSGK